MERLKMIINNLTQDEYRKKEGVANSDLCMTINNPADLIWYKKSEVQADKISSFNFGSAVHSAILEPHLYYEQIFVSELKGKETQGFIKDVKENPGKIVITRDEYHKIQTMVDSAMLHPSFLEYMELKGDCEVSVFAKDKIRNVLLKCRPDKDAYESTGCLIDLKTTADLDSWRSEKGWLNPLIKFNYGLQACHYLNTYSHHCGKQVNDFIFLVMSKTISMGRYPVGVFEITRGELEACGIWRQYEDNLDVYTNCLKTGNWRHTEKFRLFSGEGMEIAYND